MKRAFFLMPCVLFFGIDIASAVVITGFGSSDVNPVVTPDVFDTWTGTQDSTSLIVNGGFSNQIGGLYSDLSLSPASTVPATASDTATMQLIASLTGSAPPTNKFAILLYDSTNDANVYLAYNFAWSDFTGGGLKTISKPLSTADSLGSFNGTIGAWQLVVFGAGGETVAGTFVLDDMQVLPVPEPTGVSLLGMGAVGMGLMMRRRRVLAAGR